MAPRAASVVAALAIATLALGHGGATPAAAAPRMGLGVAEDPAEVGRRASVDLVGGILHFHYHQWYYAGTVTVGGELPLTAHLGLELVAPFAAVERDGAVAAGWGNLGAALHHRSVVGEGDARWLRQLTLYVSAPTATDRGDAGLAARAAADIHTALDYGDFMPGATSARLHGTLCWRRGAWSVAGGAGYRFHFFTFDQGETEFLQVLVTSIAAGYERGPRQARRAVEVAVDSWSDVLEDRWADGDHFRHVVRLEGRLAVARWAAGARLLVPLDFVLRDDQSPMIGLSLTRTFSR